MYHPRLVFHTPNLKILAGTLSDTCCFLQDASCSRELDTYFSRQFTEGPTAVVAQQGIADCSWVVLDDSNDRFVKGEARTSLIIFSLTLASCALSIMNWRWVHHGKGRAQTRP
jgi:hypothetical protein